MSIYAPDLRSSLNDYAQNLLMHINKTLDVPYDALLQAYIDFHKPPTVKVIKKGHTVVRAVKTVKSVKTVTKAPTKKPTKCLEYIVIKHNDYLFDATTNELYTFQPNKPVKIGAYDPQTQIIIPL
jgi:hypothetical protein